MIASMLAFALVVADPPGRLASLEQTVDLRVPLHATPAEVTRILKELLPGVRARPIPERSTIRVTGAIRWILIIRHLLARVPHPPPDPKGRRVYVVPLMHRSTTYVIRRIRGLYWGRCP